MTMKKVLVVAPYPYLPFFSGGQKFIAQFLAHLGRETELTVIGSASNTTGGVKNYRHLPWLQASFFRYADFRLAGKISGAVRSNHVQSVIWEHPYMGWLAWIVRQKTGVPFLVHTHNIEYQRFRSMGKWWWPLLKIYERWVFRKADGIFFITPDDRAFAIHKWKIPEEKCMDLPFAVPYSRMPEDRLLCRQKIREIHGIADDEKILLFNGLLRYPPNLEALKVLLDQVLPLLEKAEGYRFKLLVCGKDLPPEMNGLNAYRNRQVIYAGFVEDIDLYFKAADLFLNPVQSGGGIKTKMVEAIAQGTTVIATETGAQGILREACGPKLILVPDNNWQVFADAILSVTETNRPTPAAYYTYYAWENVARKVAAQL